MLSSALAPIYAADISEHFVSFCRSIKMKCEHLMGLKYVASRVQD